MAHQRNVEGLKRSAERRHQETVERAEVGIRKLVSDGRSVNFNSVHEASGVSTAWLYQHMKTRIERLRAQTNRQSIPAPKTRASDASKDAMIATLRQRVKKLEDENRELRQQVEVAYGQLAKQH